MEKLLKLYGYKSDSIRLRASYIRHECPKVIIKKSNNLEQMANKTCDHLNGIDINNMCYMTMCY